MFIFYSAIVCLFDFNYMIYETPFFRPPGYLMRMQLTAIDYTENKNRDFARDKEGNMRFQKLYNKKTKMWRPVPIKVPKSFIYMRGIFIDMLQRRIDHRKNNVAMHRKKRMDEFDPRNIRHTIAPVSPESIRVLVENRQSRFGDRDQWPLKNPTAATSY